MYHSTHPFLKNSIGQQDKNSTVARKPGRTQKSAYPGVNLSALVSAFLCEFTFFASTNTVRIPLDLPTREEQEWIRWQRFSASSTHPLRDASSSTKGWLGRRSCSHGLYWLIDLLYFWLRTLLKMFRIKLARVLLHSNIKYEITPSHIRS